MSWTIGAAVASRAGRAFLLSCLTAIAGCAIQDAATSQDFVVATADGDVVNVVHGSAKGLNNASLVRLIQAGVAQRYTIRCATPADAAAAHARLDWRVIDDGRTPTATVTARLTSDGKAIASASIKAVAPDAAPDMIFVADVAVLTQKVLPRGVAVASSAKRCAGVT